MAGSRLARKCSVRVPASSSHSSFSRKVLCNPSKRVLNSVPAKVQDFHPGWAYNCFLVTVFFDASSVCAVFQHPTNPDWARRIFQVEQRLITDDGGRLLSENRLAPHTRQLLCKIKRLINEHACRRATMSIASQRQNDPVLFPPPLFAQRQWACWDAAFPRSPPPSCLQAGRRLQLPVLLTQNKEDENQDTKDGCRYGGSVRLRPHPASGFKYACRLAPLCFHCAAALGAKKSYALCHRFRSGGLAGAGFAAPFNLTPYPLAGRRPDRPRLAPSRFSDMQQAPGFLFFSGKGRDRNVKYNFDSVLCRPFLQENRGCFRPDGTLDHDPLDIRR